MSLSKKYPEESIPVISLVKVKGLSDKEEKECIDRLVKLATEYLGEPSLSLICDACQEIFTEFNHADCSICLEKLSDNHVGFLDSQIPNIIEIHVLKISKMSQMDSNK